jgi:hypothetical protein
MPLDKALAQSQRHFLRQHGFTGTGFSLDQQRSLQGDRCIDRHTQVVSGDVSFCAFKFHHWCSPCPFAKDRQGTYWHSSYQ